MGKERNKSTNADSFPNSSTEACLAYSVPKIVIFNHIWLPFITVIQNAFRALASEPLLHHSPKIMHLPMPKVLVSFLYQSKREYKPSQPHLHVGHGRSSLV